MHNILFEHQQTLDNGSLVEYAVMLSLDINRFLREMSGHIYAQRVQEDLRSGVSSGVVSTPTFFINGVRYKQACNLEGLLVAIAQASNP
jgi:protein-disulfide isomerase